MIKSEKVSIILPVYNAQLYLDECLNSIVNQDYSIFEVIMINDGSTDRSLDICRKFCSRDNRFSLYSQVNKGVSYTRNFGLTKASGKYIYFMDADDVIRHNTLSTLIELINSNHSELAMCSFDELIHGNLRKNFSFDGSIKIFTNIQTMEQICLNNKIQGYLWNKLFLREYILNIKFEENIKICEDQLFCLEYIKKIKTVSYVDMSLYSYRLNPKSAVNSPFNVNKISRIEAYDKIIEILKSYDDNLLMKNYILQKSHEIIVLCSSFYRKLIMNCIRNRKQYIDNFRFYYYKYKNYINKSQLNFKQKISLLLLKMRLYFN